MQNFPWLTTIGLVPLLGALVVASLPRSMAAAAKVVAVAVSVLTLGLVIAMALAFDPSSDQQFQLTETHRWIPQFGVTYALGVDGIALVLIALAAVLTPVCMLAAWHDVPEVGRREQNYFALLLALETMMVGVFAATDVFLF
jgi:NADH-quinone oxidoreductase subunit M